MNTSLFTFALICIVCIILSIEIILAVKSKSSNSKKTTTNGPNADKTESSEKNNINERISDSSTSGQDLPKAFVNCFGKIQKEIVLCHKHAEEKWNWPQDKSKKIPSIQQICCANWDADDCILKAANDECDDEEKPHVKQYIDAHISYGDNEMCKEYHYHSDTCHLNSLKATSFLDNVEDSLKEIKGNVDKIFNNQY